MNYNDLEGTIRRRKSVRTYEDRPLTQADRDAVESLVAEALAEETPFPARIRVQLLDAGPGTDTRKLGTYGVIRGANTFLGVTVKNEETAPEAVGYTFEKIVLAATAMGLGTCWMAGTFNRAQFASRLDVQPDELFPIISPIGYPLEKKTLIDTVFRKTGKSDQRKPWSELFFDGGFTAPLTQAAAGDWAFPLEMLRLAPSAVNRQPWRVVRDARGFHFFREGAFRGNSAYDLQRLDTGIAACHFHLAARDRGLSGEFKRRDDVRIAAPENVKYLFSWVER